ncbi:flagellar protein FlaG [Colwellia psychrerythraea]|uniref:Flagellar protein FlaG protein n=1 Tax=Colwellia psychrerythraea TaxID=28229 RepID=A0A099KP21_COLPS|nr:flagellar protein FlaG [Colwellia psychrerythraea]KGJ91393.1 flagellar protein FlaG protein [Colwellia psychrerythraea]
MSVIENRADVNLANLTSEFQKTADSTVPVNNIKIEQHLVNEKDQVDNKNEKDLAANQAVLTPQQLEKVAQQLQDFVGEMNRGLEFSVDKDSGRDVIKVIDKSSGDLVKQYPSEEVLTLVAKLSDMVGGFVDAKV